MVICYGGNRKQTHIKIIEDGPESVLSSFPVDPETQTSLFLLPHLRFYKVSSPESILKFHKPQEFHTETLNLECLSMTFGAFKWYQQKSDLWTQARWGFELTYLFARRARLWPSAEFAWAQMLTTFFFSITQIYSHYLKLILITWNHSLPHRRRWLVQATPTHRYPPLPASHAWDLKCAQGAKAGSPCPLLTYDITSP